jgi:hypothetical protein
VRLQPGRSFRWWRRESSNRRRKSGDDEKAGDVEGKTQEIGSPVEAMDGEERLSSSYGIDCGAAMVPATATAAQARGGDVAC